MINIFRHRFAIFSLTIFFVFQNIAAEACSRLLWNTNNKAVVAARTMDWDHQFDDYLFVYPRGIEMDGGTDKNPVKWFDPRKPALAGDVSDVFEPVPK